MKSAHSSRRAESRMKPLKTITWMAVFACGTGFAFVFSLQTPAPVGTVVANYRNDFRADAPLTDGWHYLWNAPSGWVADVESGDLRSGFIGVPSEYAALQDAGGYWTPDGNGSGSDNDPAAYLKLTWNGGHPGKPEGSSNLRARYAVAAYTVPASGVYAIENSLLAKPSASGDGVDVLVFAGESGALLRKVVAPASTNHFDTAIGWLSAGQTIYVAFGPDGSATSDYFEMDFSVVRYDGDDIETQILAAAARGDSSVTITPGRYYSQEPSRHVLLSSVTGLTVNAEGVYLICQTPTRAVELYQCSHVTLNGLTVDYDPPLYTQGTIEALNGNQLDLRIHQGYPLPATAKGSSMVYAPTGDLPLKQGAAQRYPKSDGTELQTLEPNLFRYTFTSSPSDTTAVGDYFSIVLASAVPHGITLLDCTDAVLNGVTLHGAPAFGVFAFGGGRLTFNEVSVVPGNTPLLASVKCLRSSNADGIHVNSTAGDIRITNCQTEYTGDDCLVLTSPYTAVIGQPASNVVTVVFKSSQSCFAGDQLELYAHSMTQRLERTLVSVSASSLTSAEVESLTDTHFPSVSFSGYTAFDLTLDSPLELAPGDHISNMDRSNEDFLIAGNSVKNTRARGVLVKASSGVVSNNVVDTTWLAGIQLRPDPVYWFEGDYAADVDIVGNTVNNCGINDNSYGSVRIDSMDSAWNACGHQRILFGDNIISNAPGCSLYLRCTTDLELRDNVFADSHHWMVGSNAWNKSVVWLDTVDQISFTGSNTVYNPGSGADTNALLGIGTNASNISGGLLLEN